MISDNVMTETPTKLQSRMFNKYKDKTSGKLTAKWLIAEPGKKSRWICLCSCGNYKLVSQKIFGQGNVKSCGCMERGVIHGHCRNYQGRTPEYNSWHAMKGRCDNINHKDYPNYGGRGITYDPRWSDFAVFLVDMGQRPEGTSIDRIDNNGNYELLNCRWATPKQQVNNQRRWCKKGAEVIRQISTTRFN